MPLVVAVVMSSRTNLDLPIPGSPTTNATLNRCPDVWR